MHKLLVLYNEPKDPAHFRKYYVETHLPLASKMPGVKAAGRFLRREAPGPGKPPYFCVFEAEFESEAEPDGRARIQGGPGGCRLTCPTTRPAASPWCISRPG